MTELYAAGLLVVTAVGCFLSGWLAAHSRYYVSQFIKGQESVLRIYKGEPTRELHVALKSAGVEGNRWYYGGPGVAFHHPVTKEHWDAICDAYKAWVGSDDRTTGVQQ